MLDTWETSEAAEFLLADSVWFEGRRSGSFGDMCCWEGRVGSGGGSVLLWSFCWTSAWSWSGSWSWSWSWWAVAGGVLLGSGGAFSVAVLVGRGGGGGAALLPASATGDWKFFCWLRAAMRSASVVIFNFGSSTPAIAAVARVKWRSEGGVANVMLEGRRWALLTQGTTHHRLFPPTAEEQSNKTRGWCCTINEPVSRPDPCARPAWGTPPLPRTAE